MTDPRIIKKYPNRRLYDTAISSYVTLEDLRQLIVQDIVFEVRDARSGDDLTRSVLLQIIAEREEHGQPMFSTQMLAQIIRFYGDSLQGFMGSYLERSMQSFIEQQGSFRSQLNSLLGQTPWAMLNQLSERNLELWKTFQSGIVESVRPTRERRSQTRTEPPKSEPPSTSAPAAAAPPDQTTKATKATRKNRRS